MFANIRIFVYSAAVIFGLVIAQSVFGTMIERSTSPSTADLRAFYDRAASPMAGTLFFLLTFVIVPVILRVFVRLQVRIGNAELRMVTFIQQHECTITYVVWGIIAAFILVMLPTIMEDMKNG